MKECVCINLSLVHNNNFRQLYRRNLKKIYYARSGTRYMSKELWLVLVRIGMNTLVASDETHNCATRVHQGERKDWRDTRIGADHSSTRATVHFEAGSFVCWTTASTNWAIHLDFRLPYSPNHLRASGRDSFACDNFRDISNINSNAW